MYKGRNGENKGEPPNLALLAGSRHIRDEALSIYFGKNLVVITDNAYNRRSRDRIFEASFLTDERVRYIRRLQVGFSRFEMGGEDRGHANMGAARRLRLLGTFGDVTAEIRLQTYHDRRKVALERFWALKVDHLCSSGLALDEPIIDLGNCYCPDRCCRSDYAIRSIPGLQAIAGYSREKVDIVGAKDSKEEAWVRGKIWQGMEEA